MTKTEIKAAVRQRDGMRCTECKMTQEEHRQKFGRGLEVHRVDPGSPYTVEGCVTLCRSCHSQKPRSPHGFSSNIRIRPIILKQLIQMAERDCSTPAAIVNRAVRELLVREGLWPPPSRNS